MLVRVIALLLLIVAASSMVVASEEHIYGPGDWVRYEYVVGTENETCVWIIRYTIREVNATHVSYNAGLEGLVSGGDLCESLTQLPILALAIESSTPVDLRATTPESKRPLIGPSYTGTCTFDNSTAEFYKGVLIRYREAATTPFVGIVEARVTDTSIGELKPLVTTITPTPPTPTTKPEAERSTEPTAVRAIDAITLAAVTALLLVGVAVGYLLVMSRRHQPLGLHG